MFRRVMMRATRMGAVAESAGGTRALLYYDVPVGPDGPLLPGRPGRPRHGRLGSQYAGALLSAGAAVALFDVAPPGPIVRGLLDSGAPISSHEVDTTDRAAVDRAMDVVVGRSGVGFLLALWAFLRYRLGIA